MVDHSNPFRGKPDPTVQISGLNFQNALLQQFPSEMGSVIESGAGAEALSICRQIKEWPRVFSTVRSDRCSYWKHPRWPVRQWRRVAGGGGRAGSSSPRLPASHSLITHGLLYFETANPNSWFYWWKQDWFVKLPNTTLVLEIQSVSLVTSKLIHRVK